MFVPAAFVNMRVSADEVRSVIMPPGMIMTPTTSADAMRDMAAADPRLVSYDAPAAARGDQLLTPRIEAGVKVFDLDASIIRLEHPSGDACDGRTRSTGKCLVRRLEFTEGDRIRINFTNHLPDSATMHWHGLILPNAMDGPGYITQIPVAPGGRYTYEFVAQQFGTYFYHSHTRPDRQQALGLYGSLIIRPRDACRRAFCELRVCRAIAGVAAPGRPDISRRCSWKAGCRTTSPSMASRTLQPTRCACVLGESIKFRIIGTNNNFIHPMHMHGGPFTVIARDGIPLAATAQFEADVINVGPGQRWDVIWPAREPGKWIFHCHIPHHTLNNNVEEQGAGGLTVLVEVTP